MRLISRRAAHLGSKLHFSHSDDRAVLASTTPPVRHRRERAFAEVDLWLAKIATDIVPVDAELVDLTTQAWLIYGRHPAALNFADCCSYVVAKRTDEPLLFIGKELAHTDIASAR